VAAIQNIKCKKGRCYKLLDNLHIEATLLCTETDPLTVLCRETETDPLTVLCRETDIETITLNNTSSKATPEWQYLKHNKEINCFSVCRIHVPTFSEFIACWQCSRVYKRNSTTNAFPHHRCSKIKNVQVYI